MASPLQRVKAAVARLRGRSPLVDHVVRMQEHYGRVNGSAQADATAHPVLAFAAGAATALD